MGYLCANFSLPRPVLDLGPMYATDVRVRRQTTSSQCPRPGGDAITITRTISNPDCNTICKFLQCFDAVGLVTTARTAGLQKNLAPAIPIWFIWSNLWKICQLNKICSSINKTTCICNTSGVFKGAHVRGPPPFGRTAVIFVTILGLFLAPFIETKLLPPVTRSVFWPESALKCVCSRGSAPDPAGGAYSAPPALPTWCLLLTHVALCQRALEVWSRGLAI